MRLRNRGLASPALPKRTDPTTPMPSTPGSDNNYGCDKDSERSVMLALKNWAQGTYLDDVYFPAPFLFDEAGYMNDQMLFGGAPWFNRDQLDDKLLIKFYATNNSLLRGPLVIITRSWYWWYRFACRGTNLFITQRYPRDVARGQFVRRSMYGRKCLTTYITIPTAQWVCSCSVRTARRNT